MKTAIYIEDGVVQLVLTPESEFEKNAMSGFADKNLSAQVFEGSFYDCRGGWTRQADFENDRYMYGNRRPPQDQSIILRVEQRSTHVPEVVVDDSVSRRSMEASLQRANGPTAAPPPPLPPEPTHAMEVVATTIGRDTLNEERSMIRMDIPYEMPILRR